VAEVAAAVVPVVLIPDDGVTLGCAACVAKAGEVVWGATAAEAVAVVVAAGARVATCGCDVRIGDLTCAAGTLAVVLPETAVAVVPCVTVGVGCPIGAAAEATVLAVVVADPEVAFGAGTGVEVFGGAAGTSAVAVVPTVVGEEAATPDWEASGAAVADFVGWTGRAAAGVLMPEVAATVAADGLDCD
jgi:hypothetical protein